MNNFILFVLGMLILSAIAVLAIIRRAFQNPEQPKQLIFLGYQHLDRCTSCKGFLISHHNCLCGCGEREKVVVIRRTYSDLTVDFEAVDHELINQQITGY